MITGIPDYRAPIDQTVACLCSKRYLVYAGEPLNYDKEVTAALKEKAEQADMVFIDSRHQPFILCECGQSSTSARIFARL
jgi:hypothetical protein